MGCGCYETNDTGLTYLGKTLVREMNRLGILVDLSHSGGERREEAIAISTQPVVFTHSNPYEKCPNRRNPPGRLLKAAAETGGVIGINGHPAICAVTADRRPTFDDYMDVLEYTVDLVGVDHVGLGPDLFEGFHRLAGIPLGPALRRARQSLGGHRGYGASNPTSRELRPNSRAGDIGERTSARSWDSTSLGSSTRCGPGR